MIWPCSLNSCQDIWSTQCCIIVCRSTAIMQTCNCVYGNTLRFMDYTATPTQAYRCTRSGRNEKANKWKIQWKKRGKTGHPYLVPTANCLLSGKKHKLTNLSDWRSCNKEGLTSVSTMRKEIWTLWLWATDWCCIRKCVQCELHLKFQAMETHNSQWFMPQACIQRSRRHCELCKNERF